MITYNCNLRREYKYTYESKAFENCRDATHQEYTFSCILLVSFYKYSQSNWQKRRVYYCACFSYDKS